MKNPKQSELPVQIVNPNTSLTIKDRTKRVSTAFEGETMCQQHMAESTDVNVILAKYDKTGEITHLDGRQGVYADLTEVGSYQDAVERQLRADHSFMQLPAGVRNRFGHDPQQLIDFLADPANVEESIKMGLRNPKPPEQGQAVSEDIKQS